MTEVEVLADGLSFGESPRWHEGRLWLADWGTQEILTLSAEGGREAARSVPSAPICIGWLPDGRLLAVSGGQGRVLRFEQDGSTQMHADLSGLSEHAWNEIAVDVRGNAYVNGIGYDYAGGEFAPGLVAMVAPDGSARGVAGDVAFPNGMVVTPDGSTLILAESYANSLAGFDVEPDGSLSNRRTWAELAGPPDGICLDAEGVVWYADVPNRRCVRVREGGDVLETIELDRGCFSCALGGDDGRTLFMVAAEWPAAMTPGSRTGQVLTTRVSVPGVVASQKGL